MTKETAFHILFPGEDNTRAFDEFWRQCSQAVSDIGERDAALLREIYNQYCMLELDYEV